MTKNQLVFFFMFVIAIICLPGCKDDNERLSATKSSKTCLGNKKLRIEFIKTNNQGDKDTRGINHVIIFNPKSEELDFKVNVGLSHKLYAKDNRSKLRQEYVPKQFNELTSNENALLNGQKPLAAINAEYIDTDNKPQGLNISRGVEYSGAYCQLAKLKHPLRSCNNC